MRERQSESMELYLDKPIESREDDRLGRKNLAESVGKIILRYATKYSENLVVGIIGTWGSGKTSLINMIKEYIRENDTDERIVMLEFSPWYYSGYSDLISIFFDLLASSLGRMDYKNMERIARGFRKLSEALKVLKVIPFISIAGEVGSPVFSLLQDFFKDKMDLKKQKEELSELLKKSKKKILIIIDDIDRLSYNEIAQIFQLVKALADFPNVIYLLAFDRDIVAKALDRLQEGYGRKYIEKIIQLQIDLPPISELNILEILGQNFEVILSDVPEDRIDEKRFEDVMRYLVRLFSTLRDVYRYLNVLKPTFELVKDEVDPLDFFLLTALKTSAPDVYERVKIYRNILSIPSLELTEKTYFYFDLDEYLDRLRIITSEMIEKVESTQKDLIEKILEHLFPILRVAKEKEKYENLDIPSRIDAIKLNLENYYRVGSRKFVDMYFRLEIPDNIIPRRDKEKLIHGKNKDEKERILRKYIRLGKTSELLKELYRSDSSNLELLKLLVEYGDELALAANKGTFFLPHIEAGKLIYSILRKFLREDYDLLRSLIEDAQSSIYIPVFIVGGLLAEEYLPPESKEKLAELSEVVAEKLNKWLNKKENVTHPLAADIFDIWKRYIASWVNKGASSQLTSKFLKLLKGNPKALYQILKRYGFSQEQLHMVSQKEYVTLEDIERNLKEIRASERYQEIPEEARELIELILKEVYREEC